MAASLVAQTGARRGGGWGHRASVRGASPAIHAWLDWCDAAADECPPPGRTAVGVRVLPVAWSCALALLILGPVLGPGSGAQLRHGLGPGPDAATGLLGRRSSLPRAVPSDAVVARAYAGSCPAHCSRSWSSSARWSVPVIGTDRLVGTGRMPDWPRGSRPSRCTVWSPYVAERLLLGHWPMLLGLAVLPWVLLATAVAGRRRLPVRLLVLLPVGSLSASAGVATAVALSWRSRAGQVGRRWSRGPSWLAANAPWVVAGVLHADSSRSDPPGA